MNKCQIIQNFYMDDTLLMEVPIIVLRLETNKYYISSLKFLAP